MRRILVGLAVLAGCAGDPPPPESSGSPPLLAPDEGVLRLAGSGAMTPLARALGAAFERLPGSPRVEVEDSIGSGGGILAARDGAVDLGLISRRLDATDAAALELVPVGRDVVVVAAHPGVPVAGLTGGELLELVAGRRHSFADGSPARVLLRDRAESANAVLDGAIAGLEAAREEGYRRRLRVLYHDDEMASALVGTPGAIGVSSLALAAAAPGIKVLAIDGVMPSALTAETREWRAVRPLAFVMRRDRVERARPFLAFTASTEGRRILAAAGCLSSVGAAEGEAR